MSFKTRTNQPLQPEVMDYNEQTNTLEIGTNVEIDGTLNLPSSFDLFIIDYIEVDYETSEGYLSMFLMSPTMFIAERDNVKNLSTFLEYLVNSSYKIIVFNDSGKPYYLNVYEIIDDNRFNCVFTPFDGSNGIDTRCTLTSLTTVNLNTGLFIEV